MRVPTVPLALACLLSLGGCARTPPVRHVVVVTFDTLRADHLGVYGHPRATSPFWDRLAASGVRFDRAIAPMATTVPSHASLFTGLYPGQLGVLHNGHVLDDRFTTLAEIATQHGMRTAGVTATRHVWKANVDQGFETFHHFERTGRGWFWPADRVVDRAIEWLDGVDPHRRSLLWVHLFDIHGPYRPPARYERLVRRETHLPRAELARFFVERRHISMQVHGGSVRDLLRTMDRYDGEIRFADDQIARLFAAAEERGLTEDALWVLTSDHGEGLGNHDWMGHGKNIYNEQLRVPLVVWSSGNRWSPRMVPHVVELPDLFPTLLDLLGLPRADAGLPSRSLVPLLEGEDAEELAGRLAYSQRRAFDEAPGAAENDRDNYESGERFALQDHRHKYLLWTDGGDELYDLERDPYETKNLIDDEEGLAAAMRAELEQRIRAYRSAAPASTVDAEGLDELRALGYLQ